MGTSTEASRFATLSEDFLSAFYEAHPHSAAALGLHQYDGRLPDWRPEAIQARLTDLRSFQEELAQICPQQLDEETQSDYELLYRAIGFEQWEWETLRHWRTNPILYGDLLDVSNYIKRDYAPLPERTRALIVHLNGFATVLETARANLEASIPQPFIETALEMGDGMVVFLQESLPESLASLEDAELKAEFEAAQATAVTSVKDFYRWLREEKLPQANETGFAIGAPAFEEMLRWGEMVDLPLSQILAAGEAELARLESQAAETAQQIQPGRSPSEVMQSLTQDHPSMAQLIPATAAMLEELRQFTLDRQLVSIPSEVRCLVDETPPYLRWAFAMMDTPGALEEKATESFYYVTPPEDDWTPEDQEAWLSKFDHYTLRGVSIHEAYPGHYVQLLHHRRVSSTISKVFDSYSFLEGWAHYVEEMMLDEGYGDGEPRLRLAQISEALLRACRHIAAIKMHTQGMTVAEATRLFMEHAYMEELPARKEAERGTFDPGYLNYCLGKLMVKKLRADYEREQGSGFSLQAFHDHLLSHGSPPVPLVRRLILASPGTDIL